MNLNGLGVKEVQECEFKGLTDLRTFERECFVERKGVARLVGSVIAEHSIR